MLKQKIDQSLKEAMLAGDKPRVSVLRGLKSAVLYEEVAAGKRDDGLNDSEIEAVFAKEAKKRQESADLYRQGGSADKADAEEYEKKIIEEFLPQKISAEDLSQLVKNKISEIGATGPADMGKVIGSVKADVGSSADGSDIANEVKKQLGGIK